MLMMSAVWRWFSRWQEISFIAKHTVIKLTSDTLNMRGNHFDNPTAVDSASNLFLAFW